MAFKRSLAVFACSDSGKRFTIVCKVDFALAISPSLNYADACKSKVSGTFGDLAYFFVNACVTLIVDLKSFKE